MAESLTADKVKPETEKTFYILLDELVQNEITTHVSSTV